MFLGWNLRIIDEALEMEQEELTGDHRRRTPVHYIASILAIGTAVMWIIVLQAAEVNVVTLFGNDLCWAILGYYMSYIMYDAMVSLGLREDSNRIPARAQ